MLELGYVVIDIPIRPILGDTRGFPMMDDVIPMEELLVSVQAPIAERVEFTEGLPRAAGAAGGEYKLPEAFLVHALNVSPHCLIHHPREHERKGEHRLHWARKIERHFRHPLPRNSGAIGPIPETNIGPPIRAPPIRRHGLREHAIAVDVDYPVGVRIGIRDTLVIHLLDVPMDSLGLLK